LLVIVLLNNLSFVLASALAAAALLLLNIELDLAAIRLLLLLLVPSIWLLVGLWVLFFLLLHAHVFVLLRLAEVAFAPVPKRS